jgi:hypothetical protein
VVAGPEFLPVRDAVFPELTGAPSPGTGTPAGMLTPTPAVPNVVELLGLPFAFLRAFGSAEGALADVVGTVGVIVVSGGATVRLTISAAPLWPVPALPLPLV